jgi:PleD family two-component response regulator
MGECDLSSRGSAAQAGAVAAVALISVGPSRGADLSPGDKKKIATTAPMLAQARVNILIVDDEPKNLTVLEAILDDSGYRLVRAESAEQALLALLADEFALLILDIRMPGVTGFELAQEDRRQRADHFFDRLLR